MLVMPSDPDLFLNDLRNTIRSFLDEFGRPMPGKPMMFDGNSYAVFLSAIHGVTVDSGKIIDWTLLEERRLLSPGEWNREEIALARRLESLGLEAGDTHREGTAAIAPTLGMSIGMLYSLCEGIQVVCGIERALAINRPGQYRDFEMHFKQRRIGIAVLQRRVKNWIANHPLNEKERNEAMFAAKAFTKFVERHFATK